MIPCTSLRVFRTSATCICDGRTTTRRSSITSGRSRSDLLRSVQEGAARTAAIVRGLRTFSCLDEDELKTVDLRDGIESALQFLGPRLGGGISIAWQFADVAHVE